MEELRNQTGNQTDAEKLTQIKNILAQNTGDIFEDGIFENPQAINEAVALAQGITDIESKKLAIDSFLELRKQIVDTAENLAWGAGTEMMKKRTAKRKRVNYASVKMALDVVFSAPTKEEANILWKVLNNHLDRETVGMSSQHPACSVVQDYMSNDNEEYDGSGNAQEAYSKFKNEIFEKFQVKMEGWQLLPEHTESSGVEEQSPLHP